MEKQVRKLKDFLKSFKEEFLNAIDFLDKKTFHRDELAIIIKNVCVNVAASKNEEEEIEVLLLDDPKKEVTNKEDNKVVSLFQAPAEESTEALMKDDDSGKGYARTYRSGASHSNIHVSDDKAA